jgi:dolichyl-phosphate-mannose--protein O-mannosyl transferase
LGRILGWLVLALTFLFFLYQLYSAWIWGAVYDPVGETWRAFANEPYWFVFILTLYCVMAAPFVFLTPILLIAHLSGERYLRRRLTQPPKDNAVRQAIDDR